MADVNGNFFEIQRRGYMWNKNSTLDDGITSMLWDNNPNNVVNGNTPGETKLYAMPIGGTFFQSDGTWWIKTTIPNTWTRIGTGASGVVTDHDALQGLLDDDHPQYILVDGSRGFTSTVSGIYPVERYHLTTKEYVDDTIISDYDVTTGIIGVITNETPSGTLDKSNTVFNCVYTPISGTLTVALNGLHQEPGINNDYTASGSQITFVYPPLSEDIVLCDYFYYKGATTSGFGIGGFTDHGDLDGLSDDDHPQYILANGSRSFSATIGGVDPTSSNHLATKNYVDNLITGKEGSQAILNGADNVLITFASAFPNTNYSVVVTLENIADSPVSIYSYAVTAKSINGFTVSFSGDIDSANYKLNWIAKSY